MVQAGAAKPAKELRVAKRDEEEGGKDGEGGAAPSPGMKRRSMSGVGGGEGGGGLDGALDSPKHFKRTTDEKHKRKSAEKPKSPPPPAKKAKNFRECEELKIRLNVYDLVWDKSRKGGSNAGLVDLGLGFYHTGLELWGKELSFGHSKRFKSGVFAVKPRRADDLMPHTVFRESIEVATVSMSRYSVDKLLNRLSAKYTSDAYNVLRNNCNHFTEELCVALCGKNIPEWINRPAKMGTSALDALNAPFEAVNAVMQVFTPSKKANTANQAAPVDGAQGAHKDSTGATAARKPASDGPPAATKGGGAVAKEAPTVAKEAPTVAKEAPTVAKEAPTVAKEAPTVTSAQLEELQIGMIPSGAEQAGGAVMIVDDAWMLTQV